eukprot:COSAG03_NODE_3078_length_2242_cov_4.406237_3_plen_72_part_01
MMNATFAAQRLGAPIDACSLGVADSAFLQQAAHISGGTYTAPFRGASSSASGGAAEKSRLYQHLLSTFLADT